MAAESLGKLINDSQTTTQTIMGTRELSIKTNKNPSDSNAVNVWDWKLSYLIKE